MNENTLPSEPLGMAGPSGVTRKRKRSSSTSSTSSSSSSSSSLSGDKQRSRRRHKHKKSKRAKRSDVRMGNLLKEIGELRQIITSNKVCDNACDDSVSIYPNDDELYEQYYLDSEQDDTSFTFKIETKLKEPSVPKTPDNYINMLSDVQRLGSNAWSDIRYAEIQKVYNHTPGFIDLETNDEVKKYDTLRHLAYADKSYAAITYCILKQKVSLQEGIQNLLFWAKNTNVNVNNLSVKVDELFLKGDLFKVSSDLLQLVCGHRAEVIEMRREAITSQVRDPFIKAALNRIPPSTTHIFDTDAFTTILEKSGGVRKVFWPPKASGSSQAKSYQSNHRLSRGHGVQRSLVPSRGTQCHCYKSGDQGSMPLYACNNLPSRGEYQFTNYPPQLQPSNFNHFNGRGSFHNRGSRPDRGGNRGRGNSRRASKSSHGYNRKL